MLIRQILTPGNCYFRAEAPDAYADYEPTLVYVVPNDCFVEQIADVETYVHDRWVKVGANDLYDSKARYRVQNFNDWVYFEAGEFERCSKAKLPVAVQVPGPYEPSIEQDDPYSAYKDAVQTGDIQGIRYLGLEPPPWMR